MKLEELFARTERYNFVIDLTPQAADDWIKHCNTHNRKLIDGHVEYLIGEMQAGRWRLTHQGIAFSTNRVLLDGQHRLWAVALSGVTVPMRIFVNEPPEAMQVLDTGQRRRNHQIMTLTAGMGEVTHNDLAVLRAMLSGVGKYRHMSPGEEGALLSRHREAVRFALECLRAGCKFKGVATSITRGVLARAWYSADRGMLRHFADVLQSGTPTGETDQPILLLFQFLVSTSSRRAIPCRHEAYRRTERALAAFLSGNRLTKLYATTDELFPLPEEMKTDAA